MEKDGRIYIIERGKESAKKFAIGKEKKENDRWERKVQEAKRECTV